MKKCKPDPKPKIITEAEFEQLELWVQVCVWLESFLTVEHGALMGEPFVLHDFQIDIIKAICSGDYKKLAASMARANGKTTLLAAIACAYLCGPLAIKNTKIPVVAVDKTQAKITIEMAWLFLQPFVCAEPDRFKYNDNEFTGEIIDRYNNITLEAVSADPRSKHGGSAPLVIADEPAQWMPSGKKVINAFTTAAGKQAHQIVVLIGTRPDDDRHFFARTLKTGLNKKAGKKAGVWAAQYAADPDAEFDDWEQIEQANPLLDHVPALRKAIEQEIEGIRLGEEDESVFKALRMNMGCSEVDSKEYILGPKSVDIIKTCFVNNLPARSGDMYLGLDIGQARSLTAAVLYWPDTGRCEVYSACAVGQISLEERAREDGKPGIYEAAERNGELWTFPGDTTPVRGFLQNVRDVLDGIVPVKIFADRYKQAEVKQEIKALSLPWSEKNSEHGKLVFRGAGSGKDGHADIQGFCKEVFDGKLKMNESILLVSAIQDAEIKRDSNQNASLNKSRSRARIDCLQAMVMAVNGGHKSRLPDPEDTQERTFWGF